MNKANVPEDQQVNKEQTHASPMESTARDHTVRVAAVCNLLAHPGLSGGGERVHEIEITRRHVSVRC